MSNFQIFLLFFALYGIYAILFYCLTKILVELRNISFFFETFCHILRGELERSDLPDQEVPGDE